MQVPQARDWILSQPRPTHSSHTAEEEEEAAAVKKASVLQLGLEGWFCWSQRQGCGEIL